MQEKPQTWVQPLFLEGNHVRLEPVTTAHLEGLFLASRDPSVWTFLLDKQPETIEKMKPLVEGIVQGMESGKRICFAIRRKSDSAIVGSTSLFDFSEKDRKLEIGYTWHQPDARRTAINTECKYLLLTHCFVTLGCVRVQLKTDARNEASRNAIARLGAQFEGILRKFQARFDGYVRDTAMFSITSDDWPEVKKRLEGFLHHIAP